MERPVVFAQPASSVTSTFSDPQFLLRPPTFLLRWTLTTSR